jgi:hypothetical protein
VRGLQRSATPFFLWCLLNIVGRRFSRINARRPYLSKHLGVI